MLTTRVCTIAALLGALACANAPDPESGAVPVSASRQADVISESELSDPALVSTNLYEAVRRLRPRFLNARGPSGIANPSAGVVQVSVDGGPLSSASVLQNFLPNSVREVRFLSSADAAQRFGTTANGGGVILVRSR